MPHTTCPVWPCFEQEGWPRGFPDIAASLNHCVILWFYKKTVSWHLVTHPGPVPLAANLRDPWDYTTKCTGPRSLEHSFSGSSSQHTALAHSPNGPSCPPAELHRGTPVIWDQCWRLAQLEQLFCTGAPCVVHRAAKARLRHDPLTKCGTHSWHITAAGDKNVQSALATEQTRLWVPETGMRQWSWFKDTRQGSARPDLRLEKSKFWIRETTGNMPNSIPFLQTYKDGS